MTVEEKIEMLGFDDVLIYKNPDYEEAFLGVTNTGIAVYDYNLMVESLMKEDDISEIDAIEFIDYNTLGAYFAVVHHWFYIDVMNEFLPIIKGEL